ncbi:MAG: nucleotidyltransferase [Euryarchaeota archaeon]|nr:nucleotidyltransferase [Euryarchaeota archaeon]MBU4038010.1 nucleotidyltransferase [Pseudomonadota bacterium]
MVTQQQYMEQILAKYNLKEADIVPLKKKRAVIEDYVRSRYGSKMATFYYSGSYAKGTAINLKYDLDLCIYFKHNAFSSLSEMYNEVYKVLNEKYPVYKQKVAIGLKYGDDNIDVVPARKIDERTDDANLFVTSTNGQIKTNIPKHKEYISQAKCRPTIKLMKIWKFRHSLHFKSFALELLTIKALENCNSDDLGEQILHVLRFIRDNVQNVKLVDPANSNNIVSDLVDQNDKVNMKNNADASLRKEQWNDIIW